MMCIEDHKMHMEKLGNVLRKETNRKVLNVVLLALGVIALI